jgi:hypothetical protein
MTGTDRSEQVFQERQRHEQRKRQAGVAGVVVLLLILMAFMVPWLMGRRQVSGGPRAVATLQQEQCWNTWIATGDGSARQVLDPPAAWLGSTSVRGEISLQGGGDGLGEGENQYPYFVVESGERYQLANGTSSGTCQPPPTTVPLR